jgi:hypothetical protein
MTKRERLLTTFAGSIPDRLAWVADITYWRSARISEGILPEKYSGPEGYLRHHEDLGLCAFYQYDVSTYVEEYEGIEVETIDEDDRQYVIWRAPEGVLTKEHKYLPEAFCSGITKYPVRTAADLRLLCSMLSRRRITSNLNEFFQLERAWRDAGYPWPDMPRSPLPALLTEWAGVENAVYLIADAPGEVQQVLEVLEETNRPAFRTARDARLPLIHIPDNLSSANAAGYFDTYMRGYYERRLGELHEAGIPAAVHLDGTIRGLLPKLARVGFDSVEALTPEPVGDVAVEELRALAGRKDLIIWGGIPGAMFAPPYTKDDMRRHVAKVLEVCGHEPFVLGTADQIPPDGEIGWCEMIAGMVEEFVP